MQKLFYNRKKSITIAQRWEQLTAKQYIQIVKLLHSGITSMEYAHDRALHILSGKWLLFFLLIPVDLRMRMWKYTDWIFEPDESPDKQLVTVQLIKSYRPLFGKRLYAPAGEFDNLILAEFHYAEMALQELKENENEEAALNKLCATLYRPAKKNYDKIKNPDGDVRIPFNASEIEWNTRFVKRWPRHIKLAVLLWYADCKQLLFLTYPDAFDSGTNVQSNMYQGMFGMIRSIAGGKYGNFKEVEIMLVHNALMEIVSAKEEEEELKRKYPQLS